MFRERPLIWLFLIATLCVDLVLSVFFFSAGTDATMIAWMFLVPPQLNVLAVWAVIGEVDRLTRAAVVTVTLFFATLVTFYVSDPHFPQFWNDFLAYFMAHIPLVALATFALQKLKKWEALVSKNRKAKFQVSIMELIGWTFIVAIWAYAARLVPWSSLGFEWIPLLITFAGNAMFPIALCGYPKSSRNRFAMILPAAAGGILLADITLAAGEPNMVMFFIHSSYLGLYFVLLAMDEETRQRRAAPKNSDETSSPTDPILRIAGTGDPSDRG